MGRNAHKTANNIEGSKFATLICFPKVRLIPTQNISMAPTSDKLDNACTVKNGSSKLARRVMVP